MISCLDFLISLKKNDNFMQDWDSNINVVLNLEIPIHKLKQF